MTPVMNDDGSVSVPVRVEGEQGSVGDGWATLSPGDPGYDAWYEYLTELKAAG